MKKLAAAFVLIAGILWGMIGIFVRRYEELGLEPMQTAALRITLTAVMFALFVLIYKPKLYRIRLRHLWCFLGTGIVSVALFTYCYFESIHLSDLSVAAVLLYTAPAFVMLFSMIFFRERMTVMKAVALALAVLGCAMTVGVIGGEPNVTLEGFLFGLGSGICYALYSIFSRFALNRGYEPFTITLYTFIFAAVTTAALTAATTDAGRMIGIVTADAGSVFYALLFALVSCLLPYVFYTLGLKYIASSAASIIATVEPVVATVVGALVFGEVMNVPFGYIGVGLVFLSVVLINVRSRRKT